MLELYVVQGVLVNIHIISQRLAYGKLCMPKINSVIISLQNDLA